MTLTAYGPAYPAPAIDPADYPHRTMIHGSAIRDDAPTLIMWLDRDSLPMDDDALDAVCNVLAGQGAALLLARESDVLDGVVTAIRAVIRRQAGEAGEPECVGA